jgi:dihydropteroate synthase
MTVTELLKSNKTLIMGIVNMTPDSFSDGGTYNSVDKSLFHIEEMLNHGADIIDIGAESTKPGADSISIQEELFRLEPLLKKLKGTFDCPISLDTSKPEIAEIGLTYGASVINDVQGTTNEAMWNLVSQANCYYVCMHMQNNPKTMQNNPDYSNIVEEISNNFQFVLAQSKIEKNKLILDPGIGFGKTVDQNLKLIRFLSSFKPLGCPLLIGTSRKSFIGAISGGEVTERLEGTIASSVLAIEHGASILRVHDVQSIKRAVLVTDAIRNMT